MARSRSFSIYLLKKGFDASNALSDDDSDLDEMEAASLPPNAELFVRDADPYPPWWRDYFGIKAKLSQQSKGALVFVPLNKRTFVLTFGTVGHYLEPESFEHDFGLRVTLNSVDP
jgi:uncharacterized protein (TIGR04141 family)